MGEHQPSGRGGLRDQAPDAVLVLGGQGDRALVVVVEECHDEVPSALGGDRRQQIIAADQVRYDRQACFVLSGHRCGGGGKRASDRLVE
ncbi:MAG: hypothetical protein LC799_00035, partial [Actinobacteria bacterium]|nr:hypothetical protein [Actinomycetota bacterium]